MCKYIKLPNLNNLKLNFREFTVSYRAIDDYGAETYLFLLSDWDLDAAFIRYLLTSKIILFNFLTGMNVFLK